jgi:hypothetical protein
MISAPWRVVAEAIGEKGAPFLIQLIREAF